jgi:hypothetical protein
LGGTEAGATTGVGVAELWGGVVGGETLKVGTAARPVVGGKVYVGCAEGGDKPMGIKAMGGKTNVGRDGGSAMGGNSIGVNTTFSVGAPTGLFGLSSACKETKRQELGH